MNAVNPRETKEYKVKKAQYERMSVGMLTLTMVHEMYRDMKYKRSLSTPARETTPEEYALEDVVMGRL